MDCVYIFCGSSVNFQSAAYGLYITSTSAQRLQSLAVRPLCCMSVIKFLCVLEIMKAILLFSLSLSLSFLYGVSLAPLSLYSPLVLLQGALIAHC